MFEYSIILEKIIELRLLGNIRIFDYSNIRIGNSNTHSVKIKGDVRRISLSSRASSPTTCFLYLKRPFLQIEQKCQLDNNLLQNFREID